MKQHPFIAELAKWRNDNIYDQTPVFRKSLKDRKVLTRERYFGEDDDQIIHKRPYLVQYNWDYLTEDQNIKNNTDFEKCLKTAKIVNKVPPFVKGYVSVSSQEDAESKAKEHPGPNVKYFSHEHQNLEVHCGNSHLNWRMIVYHGPVFNRYLRKMKSKFEQSQ